MYAVNLAPRKMYTAATLPYLHLTSRPELRMWKRRTLAAEFPGRCPRILCLRSGTIETQSAPQIADALLRRNFVSLALHGDVTKLCNAAPESMTRWLGLDPSTMKVPRLSFH